MTFFLCVMLGKKKREFSKGSRFSSFLGIYLIAAASSASPSLDIKFVGRTTRGHTGGRPHRISYPPSFCGACLNFLARRIQPFISLVDCEVEFCVLTI